MEYIALFLALYFLATRLKWVIAIFGITYAITKDMNLTVEIFAGISVVFLIYKLIYSPIRYLYEAWQDRKEEKEYINALKYNRFN